MLEFKDYVRLRAKYHFYRENSDFLFRTRIHAKKFIKEFLIPRHPEFTYSISRCVNSYEEEAFRILMFAPYSIFDDFSNIYNKGELKDET